ncbi:hypothetical protein JG687_00000558 [Phytophthora cactorum]|uniref:Calponin-homology (CH) domain-containing protein n=1 Tax=Phytophthora cactorum TaxID=29920 RepID=A0A329T1S1_9STRA|nr:hypothetical protein Pcac1_g20508 [Phytophthora cactorum]KAG2841398.1 hypothetical protein PC112_g3423 [Phytophthora cactorum]KAG2843218.1 hypothetical protein PC111_g2440 [Phytophthora cactorum]KAG2868008.1 hypothetical protein PC113_g1485 [Phytophthora cactorum]KAG2926615.1 hypothetical protein PC114_g3770 [Phytophthora cactorum]
MDVNVLVPNHDESSDMRQSPMGGKHQRSLSLSAKWAGDKAMAIEYLRRQREVMTWIGSVLQRELPTTDLFEALKSGVVLREMMETLFPASSSCMSPISRQYSLRMAPWKERENISLFLRQCKSIGMNDLSLFCTDDLYEGTNMVQVLFCLQHFMMFSEERAGHLFKPVARNEPAMFSNQEVEMAMSKIEQAGVDAKALISSRSSSTLPAVQEKETNLRVSEPTSAPSKEEKLGNAKEEEPAESEECTEGKASVQVPPEVCNQASEDKQDVDNPADDDDLNQESGSDADNEDEETESEDSPAIEQETNITEILPVDYPSTQEIKTLAVVKTVAIIHTMAIIYQVLSDLAATIEKAEAETHLATKQNQDVPTVEAEPEEKEEEEEEEAIPEPRADLAQEAKGETVDQAKIEIEVTEQTEAPPADSTDVPVESNPAEEVTSTQPAAETTENATERKEDANLQQAVDEELEAKAMAKCTCGRCTIM